MAETNKTQEKAVAVNPMKRFNAAITSVDMQSYIKSVCHDKAGSFTNNVVALVSNSVALQACAPMSIIYAALKATALDLPLDPNLGMAYVIPYNNKTGAVAQFQLGYRGFIALALRTAQFSKLNVTDIREGELKEYDLISGDIKVEAAADRISKPIIGYLAYFKLTNGYDKMLYMSKEEIEAHAKRYSKTYASPYENTRNSSKWTTDFDAMAKKTVLKTSPQQMGSAFGRNA